MKTHAFVIALVLACLLACKKKRTDLPPPTPVPTTTVTTSSTADAAATETWTTFKSDGGKFEILSPSTMSEESNPTSTAAGEMNMHLFTAKYSSGSFQVNYTDMPANIISAAGPQKLLKGGEDGAMKAINATAETSKQIKVQNNPAREFSTTATVQGIELDYYGRAILVKNRLYQLQVIGPKGKISQTDRNKFVESFKIVK
jgi:hypothetical protein